MHSDQSISREENQDLNFYTSKLFNTTSICKALSLELYQIDNEYKVHQIRNRRSYFNNGALFDTGLRVFKGKGLWINGKSLEINKIVFYGENFLNEFENVKISCMKALLNVELVNRDLFSLYDCNHDCQIVCLDKSKTKFMVKTEKSLTKNTINGNAVSFLNSKSLNFHIDISIVVWCIGIFALFLFCCLVFLYKCKQKKIKTTIQAPDENQSFELNAL